MRLRDILQPIARQEIVDPDHRYRLLGVRLAGRGPFEREQKYGREISATTLNRVKEGDFIYSRLFAWHGAFGVISESLDGCYVSSEFPIYRAKNEQVDVNYLRYWFQLPEVLRIVEKDCSGSTPGTRNRFKVGFFENLEIPLPSLQQQRCIISQLDAVSACIDARAQKAADLENELTAVLTWGFKKITAEASQCPMHSVAPLVRRPIEVDTDRSYPELGVRSFGKGTFHKAPLAGIDVGTKRLFQIKTDDLVFNVVFAWEGAVAIAKPEDDGRVGSHRFLTCVSDPRKATPAFLRYFFLSEKGLQLLGEASPGGAGRNRTLGLKALEAIKVPLPPINDQIWFDELQTRTAIARARSAEAADELDHLIPAILHEVF